MCQKLNHISFVGRTAGPSGASAKAKAKVKARAGKAKAAPKSLANGVRAEVPFDMEATKKEISSLDL